MTRMTIVLLSAAIIALAAGFGARGIYQAGREAERKAALERSIELIQERAKTNAKVEKLDDRSLCLALGGVFENAECR